MKISGAIKHIRIAIFLMTLMSAGCSTQKNTPVTRTYHNITSKFNYYFNANESYNNSIKMATENYSYNYTLHLPVLLFGDKQISSVVGGDMDRAITKSTTMINRHSITVKPERKTGTLSAKERNFYKQNEFVNYVKEGWLLIGKARAWKGAYDEAQMTLEYNITQFPDTEISFESQVWLARIDIVKNDFVSAEDRLRTLANDRKYPKSKYFKHLLESTQAFFYQKQENIPKTIEHLQKALDVVDTKADKDRYRYLLAQLYKTEKKFAQSNEYFNRVVRSNPSYEMTFNAKISLASNYQGGGDDGMVKALLKMANDEKNVEYLDQIYFTLGNIEETKENIETAIEYYKLSAQKSVNNTYQKGISYLILGDYYFAKPDYTQSQAYYDSSYHALDADFPGYNELEVKTQNLNKLVENLNLVSTEDSLQRVAAMSPKERDAIIAELINAVKAEEERLRLEEQESRDRFSHFQQTQRGRTQPQQEGSSWYFYNQSSLSFGLAEFQMRWGRRKLEDNWRRVNKREVLGESLADNDAETDTTGMPKKVMDNKSREYYLQNLPLNDSLVAISHQRIQEALFRVAEVYENDLRNYPEAIKAYETLINRYPTSNLTLSAYYNLYQIANFNNEQQKMEEYKQKLISQFPSSTYALMLSDPNYVESLKARKEEREVFYEKTFNLFRQDRCTEATRMARQGLELFPETDIVPKLQFIIAQCIGKSGDLRAYRDELNEILTAYPNIEIASTVVDILAMLDRRELQLASGDMGGVTLDDEQTTGYSTTYSEPEGEHLFIAIIPQNSPVNQLRFNLVSFNVDNYLNLNLNVTSSDLSDFVQIIQVESFKTIDEAMEYYVKASAEEGLMGTLTSSDYSYAVISVTNLEMFKEDKSVSGYLDFFRKNYLK
ncbi:MAG: tetratricopeptide repeat protein [Bacteroidales bacterium]|nr:tetratricopeptide repeat protein [Bacteroidales bacterium]MDD4672713.1 tetratricopeptide repeat protein [Bacteroidales bacterium]MDY0347565.1 tetratricopeptide repeat protein [Tenuifilaceae bacterium]